jgi:hypothetical protein
MPIITGDITNDGAIIVVQVGVSHRKQALLEKAGFKVPPAETARAQLDTGAAMSGFMSRVFSALDLRPFTQRPVRTPSTTPDNPHMCDWYDVSVTLVSGMTRHVLPSVLVIASDDFGQDEEVQAIIGRDILNRCNLQYWGPTRKFQLSF